MFNNNIDLYKMLSLADGVAGRESEVREIIKKSVDSTNLKTWQDNFGNFYVQTKYNNSKKIMICAHMDEVGFLVKHITEDGFIYMQPLGGWWGHVLLGQNVTITSRKSGEKFRGVIGTTPSKGYNPDRVIEPSAMYVDIGAENIDAIIAMGIQPGDMITPYTIPEKLLDNNYLLGKAWDDRVNCGVLVHVMNEISNLSLKHYDIVGVGTAQEEVGTRGAKIAAETICPDIAIVLDVATAKDTPGADIYKNRILGRGPGISLYDKTAISSLELTDTIIEIAKDNNIPFQYDMLAGGGTDAGVIHISNGGIPTAVLTLGVRYCHSGASIVHMGDVEKMIELILQVIIELDKCSM
ncbi:M42 family metallopeptidase [Caldifermentibacillus hisashii]|uniref:M42 family metallopeptidase n=1 Tax=Caldifermentibacillus hisashii TaxID=996558 RepID=UPI0031FDF331